MPSNMTTCTCGRELSDDFDYCPGCGARKPKPPTEAQAFALALHNAGRVAMGIVPHELSETAMTMPGVADAIYAKARELLGVDQLKADLEAAHCALQRGADISEEEFSAPRQTTGQLLESLSLQLSAKATTNPEPMLRLRDVLEVLGAAMGTAGAVKPVDVEAVKAEARREALKGIADWASECAKNAGGGIMGNARRAAYRVCATESSVRAHGKSVYQQLADYGNACKPSPAEKKSVDVEALARHLRDVDVEMCGRKREPTGWSGIARAAIDFLAKNGGAR